jgi:hypothetical protein
MLKDIICGVSQTETIEVIKDLKLGKAAGPN